MLPWENTEKQNLTFNHLLDIFKEKRVFSLQLCCKLCYTDFEKIKIK